MPLNHGSYTPLFPPVKTFTPGLDFHGKPYEQSPLQRFERDVTSVRDYIQDNLPVGEFAYYTTAPLPPYNWLEPTTQPGSEAMLMHQDQASYGSDPIHFANGLSIMWYLVDTTEKNGATRVHPGLHNKNCAPKRGSVEGSISAEAPAGTALIFEGRLWHGTGRNSSNEPRPVVILDFVRNYIRQIENWNLLLSEDVKARLTERHKLLGIGHIFLFPGHQAGRLRVAKTNDDGNN